MKKLVSVLLTVALMLFVFVIPANANEIDYKFGDVNKDNTVDVMDATLISRHCANILELKHIEYALADFDNDDDVTVLDATSIQKYVANLIEHPRKSEYLEYYVEIEDINIKPNSGSKLVTDKSILFTVEFDDVYNTENDKNVCYEYTFKGITDETYYEKYVRDLITYPHVGWSFENPGIYEIEVKVYRKYYTGSYTFTKQFEVVPGFEFDEMRFANYNHLGYYYGNFPEKPEGVTAIEYQTVVNCQAAPVGLGYNSKSTHFVALVHTKEEYDNLFEVENTEFDDEFFNDKSLVVAVSQGTDYYDYFQFAGVSCKDDVLYVSVDHGNSNPDPMTAAPTAPVWYSFASVDKSDVEHITRVQKVR